ncbi:hypothetical protein CFC21_027431 [Triticum aestivum]|uniref:Uncharacterized protein n=4 Tax=Triticinae TaxID=1648030 RepID=A0A3B6D8J5_WHEAT|nr:hypothetical protein CFC21_027431 [Triticum aestivum]
MKVIVLVTMAMLLINSCPCIRSRNIEGNAMQVNDMRKLTSSSVDGRITPPDEGIHHVCPRGIYPCQGMFHSSMEGTEGGGN